MGETLRDRLAKNTSWHPETVVAIVGETVDPVIGDFPIEAFDPLTDDQEAALQAWFKKLRAALNAEKKGAD